MRIRYWLGVTKKSLKDDGLACTLRRAVRKINRKLDGTTSPQRIIRDVLFVNGCDPNIVPHPYRYRVLHQIEQLNAVHMDSTEIFYLSLNPLLVRDFRVIIFYRCPWTEQVDKAIALAKSLNKKVLFDIDDLVIDTAYTDNIPYVSTLPANEKSLYDDGVNRMGKTLRLCDGAVTSTEALAEELKKYVPEVYINRNVASEEMWKLSMEALEKKATRKDGTVVIGYFSGSITHNADFEMVKPALLKILSEHKNVSLLLLGELDLPDDMATYQEQIIKEPFVDWKKLPALIASVDINIAPIEETVFNAAKSENKWVEAALVKVPTVASDFGAFKTCVRNGETGLLCSTEAEWHSALQSLVLDAALRKRLAENAFSFCKDRYNTTITGHGIAKLINSIARKHIGFIFPSTQISGGLRVALMHASFLQDIGYDVDIIAPHADDDFISFQGRTFNVIGLDKTAIVAYYDVLVATLYATLYTAANYSNASRRLYLVQNYETDFYSYGEFLRGEAEKTYSFRSGVEYITISKWCEKWLKEKYGQHSRFAPNGIELDAFEPHKRNLKKQKIRILIEGDNASHYKNVDESFKIIERLDKEKYEVWYMSYNAETKPWYRVDRFLSKVPYEKVGQVYEQCDILIKSSWLESFSYPPLEMMATGGYCVVVPNGGNVEYLKDGENCLFYPLGDTNEAVRCIERLLSDEALQERLYKNGLATAKERDWKNCREQILALYGE